MLGPRGWAGEGEACERGGVVGRGRGGESSLTLGTEKGGQLNCSHPMGPPAPPHPISVNVEGLPCGLWIGFLYFLNVVLQHLPLLICVAPHQFLI